MMSVTYFVLKTLEVAPEFLHFIVGQNVEAADVSVVAE